MTTALDLFSLATEKSQMKELRDYQKEAVASIFHYFENNTGNPIVCVPTGGGKSLIIADFIKQASTLYPGTKFSVITHVAELIRQNSDELSIHYPEINVSFCSASLGKKNLQGDVVFGTIQSIYKRAFEYPAAPDLLLIDEVHLLSADDDTMYRKFINDLKIANPHLKVVGFTATPFRADQGMLHEGKNALFTDIAHEISILDLINMGYLAPIVTPEKKLETKMNTTGVKMRGGDFIPGQLEKAVDVDAITQGCVREIIEHGNDRKKWLVFTAGIEHCTHVRDEIRRYGISCEMVHGKTPTEERNFILDRYKNGDIKCVVNVMVLTTGFNNPAIDMLVFMRPTRSPVLYIQCCGRGMRIFPHKENCLLLDFGGVVDALGPIDQIKLKSKEKGEGDAPIKYCPQCGNGVHAAVMICDHCGFRFPDREIDIDKKVSHAAVLSTQVQSERYKVDRIAYYRHQKEGKPDTLRVEYLCGFKTFREWICLEGYTGRPREKAEMWWYERTGSVQAPPRTISEALQQKNSLRVPREIVVRKPGQFFEVIGAHYDAT